MQYKNGKIPMEGWKNSVVHLPEFQLGLTTGGLAESVSGYYKLKGRNGDGLGTEEGR